MRIRRIRGFLLTLLALACSSGTNPEIPQVDGVWEGNAETSTATFRFELTEEEGDVGGTALIYLSGNQFVFDVEGTHQYPDLALTLTLEPFNPVQLQGTVSDPNTIECHVEGAGFDTDVTLSRVESGS